MTISRAQMNRQLYDLGGAVDQARDFYTNNLGMNPQEANAVLSDAMASLNQQTQPQSMMQMASNGGRIGYQMGGITSMPMNFGQPLQVPQQTSMPMQPMMSSPMANYGQTPLMMQGGGIARLGYQTGGVTLPSQGSEMSQMGQMNQEQALQTIIQILIENGISPEQAQQLALQILQIFAQGGEPAVEEFANQLEQAEQGGEQVQGMAKGGIAGLYPRQGYFVGKIAKAVTGAVKGVAGAVKSVVKSPIGKLALTAAALYAAPYAFGATTGGLTGYAQAFPSLAPSITSAQNFLFGIPGDIGGRTAGGFLSKLNPFSAEFSPLKLASSAFNVMGGGDNKGLGIGTLLGVGGAGAALGSLLGAKKPEETDEQYQQRLQSAGPYLQEYYKNLNPDATPQQVQDFVRLNTVEYGGLGQGNTFAKGGIARLGYRSGSMIPPARQIEGGIIELDARKSGGYIPYGKKERVDDVPAMLAKDEFVFTSRAVKAAGGGSARQGAAKMYKLMKQLEAKGKKMERGARA